MVCVIIEAECTACGACAEVCPAHAIRFSASDGTYRVDADACGDCGACDEACDYDALCLVSVPGIGPWT